MLRRTLTLTAATMALATTAFADSHTGGGMAGDAGAMSGDPVKPQAIARMAGPDGSDMGVVQIWETPNGLLLHAELIGLEEGVHGFHVHETGTCEGDFSSAGDHYDTAGNAHGMMNPDGPHAGDNPNVFADSGGFVSADVFNDRLSLMDGDAPVMDDDGSAIIIHAMGDSYQAEAGAGGRAACGVIEAVES